MKLPAILDALEAAHGRQPAPAVTDPFEQVLLENVAYLVSDEKRAAAFAALGARVGLSARKILAAKKDVLHEVAALGGGRPADRVECLLECARVQRETGALDADAKAAKKQLRAFPGLGEPGAEKVLLFAGRAPFLALKSNGLRVLLRLGFGAEARSYASSYRSAQKAAAAEIEETCAARVRAHLLLRIHGREMCKREGPLCEPCPLREACPAARVSPPGLSREKPR